jgi:hypothetical protein
VLAACLQAVPRAPYNTNLVISMLARWQRARCLQRLRRPPRACALLRNLASNSAAADAAAQAELLIGLTGTGKTSTLMQKMLHRAAEFDASGGAPEGAKVRSCWQCCIASARTTLIITLMANRRNCLIALIHLQLLMLVASDQALTLARDYFYLHRPLGCNLCEVSKRCYSVSHIWQ